MATVFRPSAQASTKALFQREILCLKPRRGKVAPGLATKEQTDDFAPDCHPDKMI